MTPPNRDESMIRAIARQADAKRACIYTCRIIKISTSWLAFYSGVTAASVAAGMSTMNAAGYYGYTAMNKAIASQTIGSLPLALYYLWQKLHGKKFLFEKNSIALISILLCNSACALFFGTVAFAFTGQETHRLDTLGLASAVGFAEVILPCVALKFLLDFREWRRINFPERDYGRRPNNMSIPVVPGVLFQDVAIDRLTERILPQDNKSSSQDTSPVVLGRVI
tara:strand:+ start:151 stop:822 length:672 start_codon:yes stop_codon:yes gene_type:complete